jgi:hypothetical protein
MTTDHLLKDPDVVAALRHLGKRVRARDPLCPRCAKRAIPERSTSGWCRECDIEADRERRDRVLAAKRRWWREHGAEWRRERQKNQAQNTEEQTA